MALEIFNPNTNLNLTITETAARFFEKKLAGQSAANAIRLSVKKSGCTGYAYVIDMVSEGEQGDIQITLNDIVFYVSEQAAPMIEGSEIDLVTQGLNKSIAFHNPNITNSCGCGSSFSVE